MPGSEFEPRRPLHKASQRRLWCFFFYPAMGGGGCSAVGAARGKGGVLFRKREHPLLNPQRKAYIAGFWLEGLHALRSVGAVYMASP